MVVEEVMITLSGGAPWGFRLQGGAEQKKPLQVAKVRKRSKACRAGLREADELVSINESPCNGLSHAQAMNLIDSSPGTLFLRVKRVPVGFQSVVLLTRAPSPRIDKEYRASLRPKSPKPPQLVSRSCPKLGSESWTRQDCPTSIQGSEAYYCETDSDVDVTHEKQRRQKRRSPSTMPARAAGRESPEETSEMSGYDSAPDARTYVPAPGSCMTNGREHKWTLPSGKLPGVAQKEVVYQPEPGEWSFQMETSKNSLMNTDDQNPQNGRAEVDSGFQEPSSLPPLVSPERAREALQLASRKQLVPMVGPVDNPVDEELTITYMDKAKQAKLHRGDTVQDHQVKEARTKCRTIASLLTDAPNPHSRGVLMFKKRRQRSKKYTLTSFGSVDEDILRDSHEDDGVLPGSESEFDEDGFTMAPDPTWDNDYLEALEKRGGGRQEGTESPGLTATSGKGARLFEQQRKRAEEHVKKMAMQQVKQTLPPQEPPPPEAEAPPMPAPTVPLAHSHNVTTVGPVTMSTASVVSPLSMASQPPVVPETTPPSMLQELPSPWLAALPSSSVVNRTARPFTPGFITHRASTAPVVFRPHVTKQTKPTTPSEGIPAPFSAASAVSSPHAAVPATAPPFIFPPASSTGDEPFSPLTLATSQPPAAASSQPKSSNSFTSRDTSLPAPVRPSHPMSCEQQAAAPNGRTGILLEAHRRASKKPLFSGPEDKKTASPNPELLSLVQNLDERPKAGQEFNFESGPYEDVFNPDGEARDLTQAQKYKVPPPVAPKPRVMPAIVHMPYGMEGKGAELFARRQSRMDRYVVESSGCQQPDLTRSPSPTPSLPAHWKYSPNIRAPPPIGYNPLLSPSYPLGAQRSKASMTSQGGHYRGSQQKEGIRALDFMRRQPYQLNPAMFSFSGSPADQQQQQHHRSDHMTGSTLSAPRQIPIRSVGVREIRRFSTPTPMSASTSLMPTVIIPRAATTLGEPLLCPDVTSPNTAAEAPPPLPTAALPELPKISSVPVPSRVRVPGPVPFPGPANTGLQVSKLFLSAPELSPLRSPTVQAPKPRFVASRKGAQMSMWRPGGAHP
uniref:Synaptopodin 2-like protein n=1 Tax=Paramormyrops kingsleyae TaxID=1676925 RepID=A0A3B3S5J2_9TELE|nr:synaptopodin 2-like protein [Paramormyrops kingsleyae]